MGWRTWSYWLKGGLIGLILGIIISLNELFIGLGGMFLYNLSLGSLFDAIAVLTSEGIGFIIMFIGIILVYTIYGAIIGVIYGKIKNRNKKWASL